MICAAKKSYVHKIFDNRDESSGYYILCLKISRTKSKRQLANRKQARATFIKKHAIFNLEKNRLFLTV
jgi:hypothetical protein